MRTEQFLDPADGDEIEAFTISEEPEQRSVLVRFPGFVTPAMAAEATTAVLEIARRIGPPITVVADLLDVEGFSPGAAIAAIRAVPPASKLIRSIELIVDNKIVRIAAISAAHLVGVPCTVRAHR